MTDLGLRELERRFRASGSVGDEAAWLRARVKAGELSEERLRLAATLGWEAARQTGTLGEGSPDDLAEQVEAVGLECCARTALALGFLVGPLWLRRPRADLGDLRADDALLDAALAAADDVICCPCEEHREAAESAACLAQGVAGAGVRLGFESRDMPHVRAGKVCGVAAELASLIDDPDPESLALALGEDSLAKAIAVAMSDVEACVDSSKVVVAVRKELAPWLLGYSDPVRERVEARQPEAPERGGGT